VTSGRWGDPALPASYRRQQALAWTEQLGARIAPELEAAGMLERPGRVPALAFLALVGSTRLTNQRGDRAAPALAERLAVLVDRSARAHGQGAGAGAGGWGAGASPGAGGGGGVGAGAGRAAP
jgi:class 3 adenylate cyclase